MNTDEHRMKKSDVDFIGVHRCSSAVSILLFLLAAASVQARNSNSLMDISADGLLLACTNRDSGTVTIIELRGHKKLREIKIGREPEGVTFIGNTHRLAAAVYLDDKIVFLDADSGKLLGELAVEDEPYGLVSGATGRRIYATLSYPGKVLEIDPASRTVTRAFEAGPFARGIAISADDSRLLITEYHTGNVLAIETRGGKIIDRWPAIASDNLARQIILHPRRGKAYLAHIRSATERAQGEGSIFPYVTILDTPAPAKPNAARRNRIPMDSFVSARVTANPWEVAITPDGRQFFVVFAGTNEMFACEVVDDDYRELKYKTTLPLGDNPRAVRVSPNGKLLYVYNALNFNIVVYDTADLRKLGEVKVTDNPLGQEVLLGKKLFYTALQPMTGRRWISCSSCHPDGESDLRTWQNPEGLRDTPSLGGLAWTHPLHWSADRDEVQDFEHTIRGQLMQGRGLVQGPVSQSLGAPLKGNSSELDALAAYTDSHVVIPLSPHAKTGLSQAAKRGKALFFSQETNCSSCHAGPYYTDSQPDAKKVHDVGTGKADPTEKMGPLYDTPTLLGLYKTAPYLHHGKAATLKEVFTAFNAGDRHGKTSHLTPAQIDDLVEFLRALPYEDPEPKARELGLKKVER